MEQTKEETKAATQKTEQAAQSLTVEEYKVKQIAKLIGADEDKMIEALHKLDGKNMTLEDKVNIMLDECKGQQKATCV